MVYQCDKDRGVNEEVLFYLVASETVRRGYIERGQQITPYLRRVLGEMPTGRARELRMHVESCGGCSRVSKPLTRIAVTCYEEMPRVASEEYRKLPSTFPKEGNPTERELGIAALVGSITEGYMDAKRIIEDEGLTVEIPIKPTLERIPEEEIREIVRKDLRIIDLLDEIGEDKE
ncbi:hypothetical protein COU61_02420 [Candidatus Pacearchaeota archaeon CG10_big_fil_rev_8_21_14_0_10_35_13]|nr:MAG: hypothetical protein COU61_02420 [Candidatus Pacearchaeota archaeon CG10_big_fil_rev_8_21_14_0_10_35_13]